MILFSGRRERACPGTAKGTFIMISVCYLSLTSSDEQRLILKTHFETSHGLYRSADTDAKKCQLDAILRRIDADRKWQRWKQRRVGQQSRRPVQQPALLTSKQRPKQNKRYFSPLRSSTLATTSIPIEHFDSRLVWKGRDRF